MSTVAANPLVIGRPLDRVDGRLKVTGQAKYAAEFLPPGCLYAFPVLSRIAHGKIRSMQTGDAEKADGVKVVLTHLNVAKMDEPKPDRAKRGGMRTETRLPLKDDQISYAGQYVALVVAATFEQARYAASLIKIDYTEEQAVLGFAAAQSKDDGKKPKQKEGEPVQVQKGNVEKVFANPDFVKIERVYSTPAENHNPIEMSGTVAVWNAKDQLTVYDATQYVKGVQDVLSLTFGLPRENVRVISPFVGGAFGCKGAVWPHVILTAVAAKMAGAPVKFLLPRAAMFSGTGHRTPTRQTLTLAADRQGKLQGIHHYSETFTSLVGDFSEICGMRSTAVLYACPAVAIEEMVYPVNLPTPTFMRAPGEAPGTFAAESAIDELAYELKIDPLAIREMNHSDGHVISGKPWSTKFLRDAYKMGAEKFGWTNRSPAPSSMRDGPLLMGWGVATATYPAHKMSADAKVRLRVDGTAVVQCATHDLGTGAYTAFTQISAEALGLPVEKVTFELGDSNLPYGPVAGGSNSTATVGSAIYLAAADIHAQLATLAGSDPQSPLHNAPAADIALIEPGRIGIKDDLAKTDTFTAILQRAGKENIEAQSRTPEPEKDSSTLFQSFGVHFCEVKIDPLLPRVRVTRVVSVMDCGRIINAKTGRSQVLGAVVMGIGMALSEETVTDPRSGLRINRNLADYHVPVSADIESIEPYFVGEPDFAFNPMGARGLGEIGNTGIAAAVANAVFHATGKRIRDLPITPDKLL